MNHLIIGYGQQGQSFVKKMVEAGVAQPDIVVVDIKQEKLQKASERYPDLSCFETTLAALGKRSFDIAWVLVNTSCHLDVVRQCRDAGLTKFFVEKPVASPRHLNEMEGLLAGTTGVCGYILRFSLAVWRLQKFMVEKNLRVRWGSAYYGKPRIWTKDTELPGTARATEGDKADEATHAMDLQTHLANVDASTMTNQRIISCTHLPFVNPEAQQGLSSIDSDVPQRPDNSTIWSFGNDDDLSLTGISSYTLIETIRRFDFVLGDNESGTPTHYAQLLLDQRDDDGLRDHLIIRPVGEKKNTVAAGYSSDKLRAQVIATLAYLQEGKEDKRLATLQDGLDQARLLVLA